MPPQNEQKVHPRQCIKRKNTEITLAFSKSFKWLIVFKEIRFVNKEPRNYGGEPLALCFVDFINPNYAVTAMEALQGYEFDENEINFTTAHQQDLGTSSTVLLLGQNLISKVSIIAGVQISSLPYFHNQHGNHMECLRFLPKHSKMVRLCGITSTTRSKDNQTS